MDAETHLTNLTKDTFESEVTNFPGVVLVDFSAPWCGPCKIMAPRIAALAEKYKGNDQVKIVEVDVDEEPDLSSSFQVLSVPTFKVFSAGKLLDGRIGVTPVPDLENLVEQGLKAVAA